MARSSIIAALVTVSAQRTGLRPVVLECDGRECAMLELPVWEAHQDGPGR